MIQVWRSEFSEAQSAGIGAHGSFRYGREIIGNRAHTFLLKKTRTLVIARGAHPVRAKLLRRYIWMRRKPRNHVIGEHVFARFGERAVSGC